MLDLINMALTALPYLAFGWLLARDPTLDVVLGARDEPGAFIANMTMGFGIMAIFTIGAMFTFLALLFGASGWGVLLGIGGGAAIACFGQEKI